MTWPRLALLALAVVPMFVLEGYDLYPAYEQVNVSSDQRLGDASANYTVYFDTEKGNIDYSPGSLDEFQQFQPGSTWTLELNAMGGVVDVER